MNMISSEEALNTIAWVLFFGTPAILGLLIWIVITLKGSKRQILHTF